MISGICHKNGSCFLKRYIACIACSWSWLKCRLSPLVGRWQTISYKVIVNHENDIKRVCICGLGSGLIQNKENMEQLQRAHNSIMVKTMIWLLCFSYILCCWNPKILKYLSVISENADLQDPYIIFLIGDSQHKHL